MALTAGPVVVKRTDNTPASRTLAYEQQIVRPDAPAAAPEESAPAEASPPAAEAEQSSDQSAASGENAEAPAADDSSQMAALPHDGEVTSSDPNALPWQQRAEPDPAMPGEGPEGYDPNAPQQGEAYPPDPMAAAPGEEVDPNAFPPSPEDEPQEWVQVLVSGAGMHGAASEDAPALFAFPYGRTLRVVSRYEGWVEVTDPQSAATGWMKAQYLAPAHAPGMAQENEAMYQDEPPRRRGWFRRNGGFADMINRALGGH
jgi:hypothetical protein